MTLKQKDIAAINKKLADGKIAAEEAAVSIQKIETTIGDSDDTIRLLDSIVKLKNELESPSNSSSSQRTKELTPKLLGLAVDYLQDQGHAKNSIATILDHASIELNPIAKRKWLNRVDESSICANSFVEIGDKRNQKLRKFDEQDKCGQALAILVSAGKAFIALQDASKKAWRF